MPAPLPEPSAPAVVDAVLHGLVADLVAAVLSGDLAPGLVHLAGVDAGGLDLGVRPLDGLHPAAVLLGTTAPPEWDALGVVTTGTARHLDRHGGDPGRVAVGLLVSRRGEIAQFASFDDGRTLGSDEPLVGEIPDLLRRALGQPTDPPPVDTATLFAIDWLTEVVGRSREAGRRLGWTEARGCHPAARLDATAVARHGLIELAAAMGRVAPWSLVRHLVAIGRYQVDGVGPDDARWFDDGSFARWTLGRRPPLRWLRSTVPDAVTPAAARHIGRALDALGVPATAWPDLPGEPPRLPVRPAG